jgi:hypothetical protein
MPKVQCSFCGLPFSVRTVREGETYYCCSGCALASRIPVHQDALPVSRGLVIALALGFGLFNQILFAVAGTALVAEGRPEIGATWLWVSVIVGGLLGTANVTFLLTARPRRWSDGGAGAIAAVIAAWAVQRGFVHGLPAAVWPAVGANLGMAAWWSRGWGRRYLARWRSRG